MLRKLSWLMAICAAMAPAQSVISARSGVVHYIEGDVTLDGQTLRTKFGQFSEVKNGQVLAAAEGRTEVLLTPGVFLRLAENSSFRMISNSLSDTRIAVLSGSALIEVAELLPNNAITVEFGDTTIAMPKRGLFRIDADAALFRVYDGEARLNPGANEVKVKKNREVDLDAAKLATREFDSKTTDQFYRWGARRASYISAANITAARTASRSGSYSSMGFRGSGFGRSFGSWSWNPWFGMYTYLPASGISMSPFGGMPFYSPGSIISLYIPQSRPMNPMSMPIPSGGMSGVGPMRGGGPGSFGGGGMGVGMRGGGGVGAFGGGGGRPSTGAVGAARGGNARGN